MPPKPSPPKEIELKLQAERSDLAKVLAHPLLKTPDSRSSTQSLRATYFDTPDHTLRQAGISFRIRRGPNRTVQTVKATHTSTSVALARSEWEHEIDGEEPDFEKAEDTALQPYLDHSETIQPVFDVKTKRTLRNVSLDGSLIEVACDDCKVKAGKQALSFGEVELELKDGEEASLFQLALELAKVTPLRLSFRTKADRGYEAATGERPTRVKALPVTLKRKMPASEAFQLIATSCLQHLMANEEIVRHAPEPDAVHQMRVALRRLRAAITLFKTILSDDDRDNLRAELKWMADVLGEARDLDVYITKVLEPAQERHSNDNAYQRLLTDYRKQREDAYQTVQETIASPRFINGILQVAAWIQSGDWVGGKSKAAHKRRRQHVAVLAEKEIDRRWKKVIKRGKNLINLEAVERHQVRIEIKKLRYATEFFESLYKGGGTKKQKKAALDTLEAMQEVLGDLNDIAVGSDIGTSEAEQAIHDEQAAHINELLAQAQTKYKAFKSLDPFWK
jgi:triphosphatase